jgi:hypothetical protein
VKLLNVCFLLVVAMVVLLPCAQAQAFDPKVCSKKGTLWQYGADYVSYCSGYEGQDCRIARDSDVCEQGRRDRSNESTSQVRQAVGDLRARALRLPPLPPERNPLLGSWKRTAPANAGAMGGGSLGQLMTMAAAGPCGALLGAGVIEFSAKEFFSTDASGRESLGLIQR